MVSLADDFKAATTDALKKCATMLGVALHLYNGNNSGSVQSRNNGNGSSNGQGYNNGNGSGKLVLDPFCGSGSTCLAG
jgi:uncharacterized membrane protein YgcG